MRMDIQTILFSFVLEATVSRHHFFVVQKGSVLLLLFSSRHDKSHSLLCAVQEVSTLLVVIFCLLTWHDLSYKTDV